MGVVPPVPSHTVLVLLVQLTLLLGLARLLGTLCARIRMPAIVGELLAGVLVGPSVFGHLLPALSRWVFPPQPDQQHLLDAIGQLGVLLLVGLAGSHVNLRYMRSHAGTVAKISGMAFVIPLAMGVGAGVVLARPLRSEGSHPLIFAFFLAIALAVTAIPVIAKTLLDLGLMQRSIGQLILSSGAVDDALGWMLLSVVAALSVRGPSVSGVLLSVGAVAAAALAVMVCRRPIRALVRRAADSGEPATVTATVVIVLLAGAVTTQALGLEAILGAFLCGMVVASCRLPAELVRPLDTTVLAVLAPIYFAAAGLRMDLGALSDPKVLGTGLAVLAIATVSKFAGAYLGGRLSGLDSRFCIALGAGMNARGVIEVVISGIGLSLGILSPAAYTVLILVALITSLTAPPLLRWALGDPAATGREGRDEPACAAADVKSASGRIVDD